MLKQVEVFLTQLCSIYGIIGSVFFILMGAFAKEKIFGHFFSELGIAVFVAVFIGLTFDRIQKKRVYEEFDQKIEDFKSNSYKALFHWVVPESFLEAIESQIFSEGLTRKSSKLEYTLWPVDEFQEMIKEQDPLCDLDSSGKRVVMEIYFQYKLINSKNSIKKHTVCFFIEKEDAPNFNAVESVVITRKGKSSEVYNSEKIKECLSEDESKSVNNCYKIENIELDPKEHIRICIKARAVRSLDHTREVFVSRMLTQGFKVVVNDKTNENLELFCNSCSPHDFEELQIEKNRRCWRTKAPFLPYQGVMVWWNSQKLNH